MYKAIAEAAKIIRMVLPLRILRSVIKIVSILGFNRIVTVLDPNWIRIQTSYNHRQNIVSVKGDQWLLFVDANDHIGYHTYIYRSPFEMNVFHLGMKLGLKEGDTVLDIGANIGTASVPLCAVTKSNLIAVEASKDNGTLLIKNILANSIKSKLHMLALTDEISPDYIKFFVSKGNTGANSIFQE